MILFVQSSMTPAEFRGDAGTTVWVAGWRIPFLVSIFLLGISVWIRLQLQESPAFVRMKAEGTHSTAPLTESFGNWSNAKWPLLALLGLTAGQGVVWYSGQFYALFFLTGTLRVDPFTANLLVAWSLAFGTGGFVLFGWLSDKIGRKPIILGGCLIAAVTYFPVFKMMAEQANPALTKAQEAVKVVVVADPRDCSFQFNPTGTATFTSSCDVAKAALARASVLYSQEDAPAGTVASVRVGDKAIPGASGPASAAPVAAFNKTLADAIAAAGYPAASNPSVVTMAHPWDIFRAQPFSIVLILTFLMILVTMVYGPIAAALVELFPTRIRYTSMSLPYHIGNGWFGGLLPATVFAMNAQSGNMYYGLWYPIVIAAGTFIIGAIFVPETKDRDIFAGDISRHPGDLEVALDPMAPD